MVSNYVKVPTCHLHRQTHLPYRIWAKHHYNTAHMYTYWGWRLLWIGLLVACSVQISPPTKTPAPTAVLRSLPTPTSSPAPPIVAFTPPPVTPLYPTATPMVHTVVEGDTLLGIAAEHGISMDTLQIANGGLDPLSLHPGQTLIIPLFEGDSVSAVLPMSTSMSLTLSQFRCHSTPTGGHLCLAEVHNQSKEVVINVAVQVTLVMLDGSLGESASAFTPFDLLWPGQSLPLSARFAVGGDVRGAMAQVLSADSGAALAYRFAEIAVQEANGEPGDRAGYMVSGRVYNGSETPISEIRIVVTLYAHDGAVLAFRLARMTETIPAREGVPFIMIFSEKPENISHYAVVALGRTSTGVED